MQQKRPNTGERGAAGEVVAGPAPARSPVAPAACGNLAMHLARLSSARRCGSGCCRALPATAARRHQRRCRRTVRCCRRRSRGSSRMVCSRRHTAVQQQGVRPRSRGRRSRPSCGATVPPPAPSGGASSSSCHRSSTIPQVGRCTALLWALSLGLWFPYTGGLAAARCLACWGARRCAAWLGCWLPASCSS